ncbi:hypothetical protein L6164_007343 [Bauhinia variegata]|uniref:Uncharacterized protein n=1 Tax=Bauhinia variegata TaxID=167791 RepID=A0ACB9PCT3_BAUVA|nr:hypothetical protein L6164_007343 [Bauhinia variegata]
MMDDTSYEVCPPEVELYSLATGFWKNITSVAPVCRMDFNCLEAPHACVNDIIHWGARRRINDCWYHFILSFDFGEVFGEMKLPHNFANASSHTITVIGGGKFLALYQKSYQPSISSRIWVMKDPGVRCLLLILRNLIWKYHFGEKCYRKLYVSH